MKTLILEWKCLLVLLLCIASAISGESSSEESSEENGQASPQVNPPVGKIRGSLFTSRLGKKIYSFRGIRYGQPPTGQQRFQVAVPVADWNNVLDASEEGPSCPSIRGKNISEDCLRLNVYSTKLPSKNEDVRRPVIVFFHPGGFYSYSAQSHVFGPQYLLDKDVVLVTVNYRLGSLGFMSTGDSLVPGNLGFKDQVVALRWIKRNIAAFGGDPNSVTITGCSAGSISVMLHMLSPMSKDLFHRGILVSGSAVGKEPLPLHQKHLAIKQAELLGCPTDTTGAMLVCLNSKPVENFTDTMPKFFEFYGDPIGVWNAVVEPEVHGVERFLTAQPADLIRQGKFYKVPIIIGVTKDEFNGITSLYEKESDKGNYAPYDERNNRWDEISPISFMYERGTPRSQYITQELRKFYFDNKPVTPANVKNIGYMYSDSIENFPVHRGVKLLAASSSQPVYFYKFSYQGRNSFAMWNDTTPYGVVHHDDLQYVFYMKDYFPYLEKNAPEIPMVELSTAMWANFAKTGQPIPKNNDLFKGVTWDSMVPARDNFLDINLPPTMKTGFYPERMPIWERLFPLPPLPQGQTKS